MTHSKLIQDLHTNFFLELSGQLYPCFLLVIGPLDRHAIKPHIVFDKLKCRLFIFFFFIFFFAWKILSFHQIIFAFVFTIFWRAMIPLRLIILILRTLLILHDITIIYFHKWLDWPYPWAWFLFYIVKFFSSRRIQAKPDVLFHRFMMVVQIFCFCCDFHFSVSFYAQRS